MVQELPKRKNPRLKDYDYSSPGAYFITICTHNKVCTLSRVVGAIQESPEIKLTKYGKIADTVINEISCRYGVAVDSYVIMPNHIHLILVISDEDQKWAIRESPLQGRSIISKVVGYVKMNSSKEIHKIVGDSPIWQRSFYDHIIRDRQDYDKIAKYVQDNPFKWQDDCFYSE